MRTLPQVGLLACFSFIACQNERQPIAPRPYASVAASPDNFVAFFSERSGSGDIYLYDASTTALVQLPGLNSDAREVSPAVTPDGRFIAFQRTVGGQEDVFLYDRSTSALVDLPGLNSGFDDAGPALTPDARFIAFTTARSGDVFWEDVLLYDRSTSSLVPLPGLNTNGPSGFHEGTPSISADGNLIAFRSNRSGVTDIFLYDRSASSLVPLPGLNDPTFVDDHPSISGDGRFIAFQSDRSGVVGIYLYDRATSSLVPLPGLVGPASTPSISADGRFIAFVAPCVGLADVFVYDRSTSSLVNLPGLNDPGSNDHYPAIGFSGSLTNSNSFQLRCRLIRGIAYDAGVLWITHSAPEVSNVIRIAKVNPATGATLAESGDLNWNGRGITVGTGSLWVADALADVVHRVDPSSFSEIGSPFSTPGSEPTGIAFDGVDLWLTDPFFQRIYHLRTSGLVLGAFSIPNAFRQGLEWEGNGMWTNTGATEQSHYLPDGTLDATRAIQGLPSGTSVGDIAIGNRKVYVPSGSAVYTLDWAAANQLPTVNAGPDVTIAGRYYRDFSQFPPKIVLNGSAQDPEGDPLVFTWKEGGTELGSGPTLDLTGKLGPRIHTITLIVNDGHHTTGATAQVVVTVPKLVVLVHGWNSNPDGAFGSMGDLLARRFSVVAFDYHNSTSGCGLFSSRTTIETIAGDFGTFIQNSLLVRAPGYAGEINIFAHSMGGLVVREYIAGLSGVPYHGEIRRVLLAATPNYGIDWSQVPSVLCAPLVQAGEMTYGSDFWWKLHFAWAAAGSPPLAADNVVALAGGSLSGGGFGCNSIGGDNDGVVKLWSGTLPEGAGRAGYLLADHSAVWPPFHCSPPIAYANDQSHPTYVFASDFFDSPPLAAPPYGNQVQAAVDPIRFAEAVVGDGVLLIRLTDQQGRDMRFFSPPTLVLSKSGGKITCRTSGPSVNCVRNLGPGGNGVVAIRDVPSGTWTLEITGTSLAFPVSKQVTIPPDRATDATVVAACRGRVLLGTCLP